MGRASSSKKVARIASTGGGRTARGRTPWLWYGGLSAVLVVGLLLVVTSRSRLNPNIGHPNFSDHWHTAYGIYLCDQFVPGLSDAQGDKVGIHSHGDGLVHIHPKSLTATAENATLDKFFTEVGAKASKSMIGVPGRDALRNGDKCGSKSGKVQVRTWDGKNDNTAETYDGDPNDLRLENGHLITIAFVADGTTIPKPPSAVSIDAPSDLAPAPETPEVTTPATAPAATTAPPPPTTSGQ